MKQNKAIRKYDSNGNEIHYKNSDGYEYWKEYDSNERLIHFKNSNGLERWYEYDSNGKEIHFKDSDGCEYWKQYDSNGKLINTSAVQPNPPTVENTKETPEQILAERDLYKKYVPNLLVQCNTAESIIKLLISTGCVSDKQVEAARLLVSSKS